MLKFVFCTSKKIKWKGMVPMDNHNYSEVRVFIGNLLTGALAAIVFWLTRNIWVTGIAFAIIAWLMTKIVNKMVRIRAKALAIVIIAILFAICAIWFRAKDNNSNPSNEPGVVIQDDTNKDDEDKDNQDDDSANVEPQSVTTGGSNYYGNYFGKSSNSSKLAAGYSNVGGSNSSTPNSTNQGNANSTAGNTNKITAENNKSQEEDANKKIQEDLNNGKQQVDLGDDITATVDKNTTETKDVIDSDQEIENKGAEKIDSGTEEKIPDPLPENEQLKQDVKESDEKTLDEFNEETKTTDKTDTSSKTDDQTEKKDDTTSNDQTEEKKDDASKEQTATEDTSKDTTSTETTNNDEEKQDDKSNDSDKEATTTVTPVTIESLDGDKAIAGDTVQFKTTGKVKTIEGLEGLNYSYNGEYVTINTAANEGTVITLKVIGEDGASTATASVTVSVLNS